MEIIQKYLLFSNEYEKCLLEQILEVMSRDVMGLYSNPNSPMFEKNNLFNKEYSEISSLIANYVTNLDDTNIGETLLMLTSLPVIAKEIKNNTEMKLEGIGGVAKLIARDKVDTYMKNVFEVGYNTLYLVY